MLNELPIFKARKYIINASSNIELSFY